MKQKLPFWQAIQGKRVEKELPDVKPLYTHAEAITEANRCLYCYDAPCIKACPTAIDIPAFIRKISTDNIRGSAKTILSANMLGYSCSRVCPVEELCAGACVYNDHNHQPIEIGRLQRYATQHALTEEASTGRQLFETKPKRGKKVALIGSGPASLACAAYLALEGVEAVIFEKNHLPGGLNTTGVAPYKMRGEGSLAEVQWILNHGIELLTETEVGVDVTFDQLRQLYDAVFIGVGLGMDKSLCLGAGKSEGYWGATELISKIKCDSGFFIPAYVRSAVIIGGGNTAIDIARELAMLGLKDVTMVYRRSEADMSGYAHELEGARRHGVVLLENAMPTNLIMGEKEITGVEVKIGDKTKILECDWVVEAIGQQKIGSRLSDKLRCDQNGCIIVDHNTRETSIKNVYAGGDCINGGKEVVNAAEDGKQAAFTMLDRWGIISDLNPRKP